MITYACNHTEPSVAHRIYSALLCPACKAKPVEAATEKYWLHSESLTDYAVIEVVCEMHGGKILKMQNGNWQVQLTPEAAKAINDRYNWDLK